jgi:hypothetical protein
MKRSGFLIIEQVFASLILSIALVSLAQFTSYYTIQTYTVFKMLKITNRTQEFLNNFNSVTSRLSNQDYDVMDYVQTNYTAPSKISEECINNYCSLKVFINELINNFQYNLVQIDSTLKSVICLDRTPYNNPTENSPNCNGSGDLVLKIFWQNGHDTQEFIYKLS